MTEPYIPPEQPELRDPVAERQLLAIALGGRLEEFLALPPAVFTSWQVEDIATVLRDLAARGIPTDLAVVAREVVSRAGTEDRARQLGKLVADLGTSHVPPLSAGYYAERLAALYSARTASSAAYLFSRQIAYAAENDDPALIATTLADMRDACDRVEQSASAKAAEPPMSLGELLEATEEPYDWLVPDLLERMDRLMVTGFEGHGKSMLLAQMACTIAAGLHPFTGDPLPQGPQRVLIFDVENSKRQMQRRYRRLRWQVDTLVQKHGLPPINWWEQVRVVSRPEGVALSNPRELARIEQATAATAPDMMVAGPLYKLAAEDIRDEQAAKELISTLDGLRVRHRFTLLMEAHAGHANDGGGNRRVRPIGSSVFLRWPEFGFGIAPHGEAEQQEHPDTVVIKHWRGSRDERWWPRLLEHGTSLPWRPANPEYWDIPERRAA